MLKRSILLCTCREKKHYPYHAPREFAYRIEIKENAPELLRRLGLGFRGMARVSRAGGGGKLDPLERMLCGEFDGRCWKRVLVNMIG